MVLSCYLDDSHGERRTAIAGYVAPRERWDTCFIPVWQEFLDSSPHPIKEFHAAECKGMWNEFSPENGWTKSEANRYGIRAVHVLSDAERIPDLHGFGVAMLIPRIKDADDEERAAWERQALILCFSSILAGVLKIAQNGEPSVEEIQFVCDRQPGLQDSLSDAFDHARKHVEQDCHFAITGLDFRHSHELLPLQAADIIANETRLDLIKRLEEPQRTRSRALHCLMRNRPHTSLYIDHQVLADVEDRATLPPLLYASGVPPWKANDLDCIGPAPIPTK